MNSHDFFPSFELYKDLNPTQWPIVYSPDYNISFFGLQRLHPFDSGKWGRTVGFLLGMFN